MSDGEADPANSGASSSSFPEKDPRKIARKYQLELCKKAMEENIIVYLGTGCGKTHIAVLLIYELGHLIKRPQENICVFLAPTVALVQQQAKVIEDSTDFKVKICSGNSKRLKSHEYWEKDMKQYEVLVMIPQILVHCLSHCLMKMDSIALLIFDECHNAQVQSNHPYAEIMRVFYKTDAIKRPRIFGMTASPVIGKGASSEGNLAKSINSLESLLDAKVYLVEDKNGLDSFVATATVRIYHYDPVVNGTSSPYIAYYNKLGDLKRECMSELSSKKDDLQSLRNSKKLLNKLHDNMIFCLKNLGFWGALQVSTF
ncbi:Dicer-like protein 4 [Morus notabilis]|uniref:Dicer-like protein 4 n=1 Tax=Morus notabilis TaxID=981085 RepID=W9S141_9ROSA|nr:Dicer-like protein 4 [Morus notabilis]